jgi:hypothetical protein
VEQGRSGDALGVLEEALEMARRLKLRDDHLAFFELALARAEQGVGRRDDALARARRARELADRIPGQVQLRARAAQLVASLQR